MTTPPQVTTWKAFHVTNAQSRAYWGDRTDILEYQPQDPNAMVFATAGWDSRGPGGVYVDDLPSVFWDGGPRCWCVYTGSGSIMNIGTAFNVFYTLNNPNAFIVKSQISDPTITTRHYTYINNALTNNNPDALLMVSANLTPGGVGNVNRQEHPIGVWYDPLAGKWAIFNQDMHLMEDNLAFNVLVGPRAVPPYDSYAGLVHIAQPSVSWGNYSWVTHDYCDGDPSKLLLVTPVWESEENPGPTGGVFFPCYYGVRYAQSLGKWVIYNQAGAFSQYVVPGSTDAITLPNKYPNLIPDDNGIPSMAAFHVLIVDPT